MSVDHPTDDMLAPFLNALPHEQADTPDKVVLAVSGGGDSIAMMHLAVRALGVDRFHVVSVDHGLRAEAKDEIALVAAQCAELGISHDVLHWTWDGKGNLQAAARQGRWAAIRDWAQGKSIQNVWLGHTADDQVETFLMRLARGSGVDGLTAMTATSVRDGLQVYRPLLSLRRADLRTWLQNNGIAWCDDPSNDDPSYARVRARQMGAQLETLGLTHARVLQTVDHMQAAQATLRAAAQQFAQTYVTQEAGDLVLSPKALEIETADAPRRVLAAALQWVAGHHYRPRFQHLRDAIAQVRAGQTVTLAGCVLAPEGEHGARIMREAAATVASDPIAGTVGDDVTVTWDGRWRIQGPWAQNLTIKALGDGLAKCSDWRSMGMPRKSLLASPSVWGGDALIAAPCAGLTGQWSAQIVADFHSSAFAIED